MSTRQRRCGSWYDSKSMFPWRRSQRSAILPIPQGMAVEHAGESVHRRGSPTTDIRQGFGRSSAIKVGLRVTDAFRLVARAMEKLGL